MPSLFSSSKPQFGIMFDVGPSSVAAGLARFKKSDVPQIIYTVRKTFPLRETVDAKRFFGDMIAALKHVNELVLREAAGLKVSHVAYSLASPWSAVQTKVVSVEKAKPFKLTPKMLDKILSEQQVAFEKIGLGQSLNLSEKLSAIEKRLVEVRLDGKAVESPFSVPASKADLSVFLSLAPRMILEEISDAAIKTFHPKDTQVFSFPLVSYSMIRDLFHEAHDFMSLAVGGEISDISIVHGGLIAEAASFPLGTHFLVREIAREFSASLSEAESILSVYFKGDGTAPMAKKVEEALSRAADRWVSALNEAVAKFASAKKDLPNNLFLIIDGAFTEFFLRSLRANASLDITLVNPEKLREYVVFFPRAKKDPFLALIAAFVNKSRTLEASGK